MHPKSSEFLAPVRRSGTHRYRKRSRFLRANVLHAPQTKRTRGVCTRNRVNFRTDAAGYRHTPRELRLATANAVGFCVQTHPTRPKLSAHAAYAHEIECSGIAQPRRGIVRRTSRATTWRRRCCSAGGTPGHVAHACTTAKSPQLSRNAQSYTSRAKPNISCTRCSVSNFPQALGMRNSIRERLFNTP